MTITRKIQEIRQNISALPFEGRIFLLAVIAGIVMIIIGTVISILSKAAIVVILIPLIVLVVTFVALYFILFKRIYAPFVLPVVVLSLIGISLIWIKDGGVNGSNMFISLVVLILGLISLPHNQKTYYLFIYLIVNTILYYIQWAYPEYITTFSDNTSRLRDGWIVLSFTSISIYFIIGFLIKQYTLEKNKSEKTSRELEASYAQLEVLNSSKDKFFSIIAHDLKSPFSGFLGLTKIMLEEYNNLTPEELREFIKNLHDSSNHLYKLLENLLEWSLVQRGAIRFNTEVCYLGYIAKQNIDVQTEIAKQKNLELSTTIPDDIQVVADIPMLNAIIRNLLSNAIKFTPRGGKIEVGVGTTINTSGNVPSSADNNQIIHVYIKDNGIGMSEAIVNKLFKIDEKTSRPGTENEPSTGLGLLLCKEFVQKHGGDIWVESEVGKGSVFYFTLHSENNPTSPSL